MMVRNDVVKKRAMHLAEWLIIVFLFECTIGSSGRWLELGPMSIRIILFVACFAVTLPLVISNFRNAVLNIPVLSAIAFGLWYLVSAVIGFNNGNKTGFITADITAMLTLALLPGFLVVMCNRKNIMRAIITIFTGATLLSIVVTAIHFIMFSHDPIIINTINDYLNLHTLGGLAALDTGIHRIYMRSQMFLPIGLLIGVWLIGRTTGWKRAFFYVCETFLLFSLILSYTRGFWLGFCISAFIIFLMHLRYWKKFLTIGAITIVLTSIVITASCAMYKGPYVPIEIVNRFSPTLFVMNAPQNDSAEKENETVTAETEELAATESTAEQTQVDINNAASVSLRAQTLDSVKARVAEHPIIGCGLGANLDGLRTDGKIEYMYWDILFKTGIIGLVLFIMTFFFCPIRRLVSDFRNYRAHAEIEWESDTFVWHVLLASYLGLSVTSWLNPFLSNPMGIMTMMLIVAASYIMKDQNKNEKDV